MKTRIILALALVSLATGARGQGLTKTLTFDDVFPAQYVIITNGYHGLQWSNFFIEGGGFNTGAVSSPNAAFNGLGYPASVSSMSPFTLNSACFTAIYVPEQQILAEAFTGGALTYANYFTINGQSPTLINFNYAGVDRVQFSIETTPSGLFAMDNMVVVVPEPSVAMLIGAGLSVVMVQSFIRKTRAARSGADE